MTATPAARGYLRQPTICGDSVVFCCEDDLWQVGADGGMASRLTAGTSESSHPRLAPGGDRVAYVGADDGPSEIYVLPLSGGPARRLTFQSARCEVAGWHPRTGEVVFASTAEQPAAFGFRLFTVDPDGGPTRLLYDGRAGAVSYGPHSGVVLGRSIADPARRKRYRGGAIGQLWVDHAGTGEFVRLPCPPGNLAYPCWVGDRIYFISDHDGVGNVYSVRPDGSELACHSEHRSYYARNLSTDGVRLVYQVGAQLGLLDPEEGRARPIDAHLSSSRTQTARRFVPAAEHLDSVRLAPGGTGLALVARGKPFTLEHWSGPVRQLGRADGVRYRMLNPLAGSADVVAVAADDRVGERLVVLPEHGGPPRAELELDDLGYVTELVASPASTDVAFATNRQQLWVTDTASARPHPRLLDSCPYERIEDLAWSPDGRWLAYTYPDTPGTSAIKLADLRTGRSVQITEPVLRDSRPAFDPGGRYLYFIAQREMSPDYDQVQFNVGFRYGTRPYLLTLRADLPSPFAGGSLPPPSEPGASGTQTAADVEIDLEGIENRVVAIPMAEGRYVSVLGLDDRILVHSCTPTPPEPGAAGGEAEGTVTLVDLSTGDVTPDFLDSVDEISVGPRGGSMLYRSGERVRVLDAGVSAEQAAEHVAGDSPPGRRSGWIDLDRVRVPVQPAGEWRQMFREAWRLQRETLPEAATSGLDWTAMYDRYAPLADRVASRSELSDLLWELQGELSASHAYEQGGDHRRPDEHPQGHLGIDWAPMPPGERRWQIATIVRGDPWNAAATSPCNGPGCDARPGDEVVAVNGQSFGPGGPAELLVGQADRDVELTLTRPGSPIRRVAVRALADESRARYLDWAAGNRGYVRTASGGRLGYVHIPDMFAAGYADFVRGFLAELDREGLVIDVRGNAGGHVSPLLLDKLARRRGGAEHGRWSGVAPYPVESAQGPMAVLIDDQTGSDGELFAHMFRDRGLGVLIGARTWGGTIATWPRHGLVDGTMTTQPEFRYLLGDLRGGLENHGVAPDIEVDTTPRRRSEVDAYLNAAVHHLCAGLAIVRGSADQPQPVSRSVAATFSARGPAEAYREAR